MIKYIISNQLTKLTLQHSKYNLQLFTKPTAYVKRAAVEMIYAEECVHLICGQIEIIQKYRIAYIFIKSQNICIKFYFVD